MLVPAPEGSHSIIPWEHPPMDEVLTITEIEARFDSETRPKRFTIIYTGKMPRDTAIAL